MINTPDNTTNTKDNIKTNKVNKTRFSISSKIIDIIDSQSKSDGTFDQAKIGRIEKGVRIYIKNKFKNIENGNQLSVFKKYFSGEDDVPNINNEKLYQKFEKYSPIHMPRILDHIQGELISLEYDLTNPDKSKLKPNQEQILYKKENIIRNTLKKYAFIIYILGEKIKLGELSKFLTLDIKAISSLYKTVSQNINQIDDIEKGNIKKIKESIDTDSISNDINEDILTDKMFATTYRNIFKRVVSNENDITLINNLNGVSNEIEQLFSDEIINVQNIFSKWCDSGAQIGTNLLNLEILVKKIMYGINTFKKLDIAFTDGFNSNPTKKNFLYDINETILNQIEDGEKKELFTDFIKCCLKEGTIDKYNNLIEKINETNKKNVDSKIPEHLSWQNNLNLKTITFDDWEKVPEEQKYVLMFSKIIGNNGKINISKYIEIQNIDKDLLKIFTESNGIDYNIVYAQFIEICAYNDSIESFIRKDKNNLDLLIKWWRFILKTRKLQKEKKDITIDNINNIYEKPYGFSEILSAKLNDEGLINDKKFQFTTDGLLNNDSVDTIEEQIKSVIRGFKNGPFDFSKTKIRQGETYSLISELSELYIPNKTKNLSELKKEIKEGLEKQLKSNKKTKYQGKLKKEYIELIRKIQKIRLQKNYFKKSTNPKEIELLKKLKDEESLYKEFLDTSIWLESGIDVCFNILKNKKITDIDQKLYLEKLIKLNILPKDLKNMNTKDFENIQELVETLKYIKSKRHNVIEMVIKGNNAKEYLLDIVDPDSYGPQKGYKRAFEKLIKLYGGDYNKLTDLIRGQNIDNKISDIGTSIFNFTKKSLNNPNVINIRFRDRIGEPIKESPKPTGYRDFKVFLKLINGTVSEHQFHQKEMHEVKEIGIKPSSEIIQKMKKEQILLSNEELEQLFSIAKEKEMNLPSKEILENIFLEGSIYPVMEKVGINESQLNITNINTNYTYKISRALNPKSSLIKKLKKLEKILSDYSWSEPVIEFLKEKLTPHGIYLK